MLPGTDAEWQIEYNDLFDRDVRHQRRRGWASPPGSLLSGTRASTKARTNAGSGRFPFFLLVWAHGGMPSTTRAAAYWLCESIESVDELMP